MEIFGDQYAVGCTSNGEYFAYLLSHEQCCAYGESAEEALANLQVVADEYFDEVYAIYGIEDIS